MDNNKPRKKLGIDCDGVLCDFTPRMKKLLNELFGMKIPPDLEPTSWDWLNFGVTPQHMIKVWERIREMPNFWEESIPSKDIVDMAEWFSDHADRDCEVFFVTSRIETAGRSAREQTARWLREYLGNPKQDINVIVTSSGMHKAAVLEVLEIGASLDDFTPTIINSKTIPKHRGYLLDKPWNQDGKNYGVRRVYSVREFLEIEGK